MNRDEKVTYVESAAHIELDRLGNVVLFSPEIWEEKFLARPDVDPLNVHKPYGLVVPQFVNDEWAIGLSASHLVRPVEDRDDRDLNQWLEYWFAHIGLHLVVMSWAHELGESSLSFEDVERRVDAELATQAQHLHAFGEHVKLLTTT